MVILYEIKGKFINDITEEFIELITEDFYKQSKINKNMFVLTDGIKIIKQTTYYIQTYDFNSYLIDKKIKQINPNKYGVTIDKQKPLITDITNNK